jgi:HTH-type transcriptional regulator / antitoxin HipB
MRNDMKKKSKNLISFEELLEAEYGKRGNPKREEWERGFEAFKLGVLLEEARKEAGLTQEELADRCGTNKSYISRIENDASDLRVSTLLRIVQGLGFKLKLTR